MTTRYRRRLTRLLRLPTVEQLVRRWLARRSGRALGAGPAPSAVTSTGRGCRHRTSLPSAGSAELRRLTVRAGRLRELVVEPPSADDVDAASVRRLAAAGVPLRLTGSEEVLAALRPSVDERLWDVVTSRDPEADDLARYVRSVRLERTAAGVPPRRDVSVLLATRRPEMIDHAVGMIRRQHGVDVQLVVGLHGSGWPASTEEHLATSWPGDLAVERPSSDIALGAVLNRLLACADGTFVSKWDDDDWYGEHHLMDLVRAHADSGATLVGKAAEFVFLESADRTVRRPAWGARTFTGNLAGGTLLLRADDLRAVHGFPETPRSVDRGLIAAVGAAGGAVYRTHGLQFVLRRSTRSHHTWDIDDDYFIDGAVDSRPGLDLRFADIDTVDGPGTDKMPSTTGSA